VLDSRDAAEATTLVEPMSRECYAALDAAVLFGRGGAYDARKKGSVYDGGPRERS
jgi:hypothetical protein